MREDQIKARYLRTEETAHTRELACLNARNPKEGQPFETEEGYWLVDGDDAGFTVWRLYVQPMG